MKKMKLIILLFVLSSCTAKKIDNSFRGYETEPSVNLMFNGTESILLNELKFHPYYNSNDLQKFLFQKFGKWDNVIVTERAIPFFVWSEIKLLDGSNELFTIGASGEDSKIHLIKINGDYRKGRIYYCSAIVLNENDVDCFNKTSKNKDSIVKTLMEGAKHIKLNDSIFEYEMKKVVKK